MRAALCLDPDLSIDRIQRVVARAGLDTVVLDVAAHPSRRRDLASVGLDLVVNVPLMFDPAYLAEHPEDYALTAAGDPAIDDWLHMACPSSDAFWTHRTRVIREQLDGAVPAMISLDFARQFLMWERVRPGTAADDVVHGCWCPRCLDGLDPRRDREELARSRCDRVAARVRGLGDLLREDFPGVPLALKVVPWLGTDHDGARESAAGQDVGQLSRCVDVLMPMVYTATMGRQAGHIASLHAELAELTGRRIIPWVQAEDPFAATPLPLQEFEAMFSVVERLTPQDFCVFHLAGLESRPDIASRLARSAPRLPRPLERMP